MFKLTKMELPSEVLDTMDISADKDVLEALNHTVTDGDIIIDTEAIEDTDDGEVEEIIEIIEEVEETDDDSQEYAESTELQNKQLRNDDSESMQEASENEAQAIKSTATKSYRIQEESLIYEEQGSKKNTMKYSNEYKTNRKGIVAYDVDEDWQDDEVDHLDEMDSSTDQNYPEFNENAERVQRYDSRNGSKNYVNNQGVSVPMQSDKSDTNSLSDCPTRTQKLRSTQEYGHIALRNVDNNQHDIVKNTENNLVYTVLGPKKQSSSTKQIQSDKIADSQYVKMEQLNENTIPVEGTIYYEGDNMETLYVAQPMDENEQYQYDAMEMENEDQGWEVSNQDTNQEQGEENSQDQIFLHEDEDGQLYFKDDNGDLQPVYLTEDGNYAIAENSDDQDSQEPLDQSQQNSRLHEEDSFLMPESEHKNSFSKKQSATISSSDLDNEDNTVTISLIISEDENGQKRTQVIIPTTDNMKCDICNKSFKTSFQLLRHNRLKHAREEDITTRNFPCDLCPKRYPDQNSLARHRKTHTGDRPFQCLECHKNFPTATALRRHLTLHNSQSRPLPCIYCGRRFVEKASLMKHEQSHLPSDQRNHTCDVCHKTFSNSTDLSLHKKYHDPDKKFDCEVCGREFNRLNNLQRHMMVHQQQQGGTEEILSCDVCGITYKFMSSLTRHIVTSHMNPEKLKQQAEEQRKKRENNYRRYLENRKMYETQPSGGYAVKRGYHHSTHGNDETA